MILQPGPFDTNKLVFLGISRVFLALFQGWTQHYPIRKSSRPVLAASYEYLCSLSSAKEVSSLPISKQSWNEYEFPLKYASQVQTGNPLPSSWLARSRTSYHSRISGFLIFPRQCHSQRQYLRGQSIGFRDGISDRISDGKKGALLEKSQGWSRGETIHIFNGRSLRRFPMTKMMQKSREILFSFKLPIFSDIIEV